MFDNVFVYQHLNIVFSIPLYMLYMYMFNNYFKSIKHKIKLALNILYYVITLFKL